MEQRVPALFAVFVALALSSCGGKHEGETNGFGAATAPFTVPCESATGELSDANFIVQGPANIKTGEDAQYVLGGVEDCQNIRSITWSAGDGAAASFPSSKNYRHTYGLPGVYYLSVDVVDASAHTYNSVFTVGVVSQCLPGESECALINDVFISAPPVAKSDGEVSFSLNIPGGLTIDSVTWNFGDSSPVQSGNPSQSHHFENPGIYEVTAQIQDTEGNPLTLKFVVQILAPTAVADTCSLEGTGISSASLAATEQSVAFKLSLSTCLRQKNLKIAWDFGDGSSDVTKQEFTHAYVVAGNYRVSVRLFENDTSTVPLITLTRLITIRDGFGSSTGTTTGGGSGGGSSGGGGSDGGTAQHCAIPGQSGQFLQSGESRIAVNVGTISEALSCTYGESGLSKVYQKLADLSCENGVLSMNNVHKGEIILDETCPTYDWVALSTWQPCSADCGGSQSRNYECRDNHGVTTTDDRCTSPKPVETQICDGNPDLPTFDDVPSTEESASGSACPADKIGIVLQHRQNTTHETLSCIDHTYTPTFSQVENGAWVETPYCNDFSTIRCNDDSIDNDQAAARYQWMQACRTTSPVIDEFLTRYATVSFTGIDSWGLQQTDTSLVSEGRKLYPTFKYINDQSEDVFYPAPTALPPDGGSFDCNIPATVYVAAVCVSSCVAPDQEIIASLNDPASMRSMKFIDAQSSKAAYVANYAASLDSDSLSSEVAEMQHWVTELSDTHHDMLLFTTESGNSVKVTLNHPLLDGSGVMREASSFVVGDELVRADGTRDKVVAIEKFDLFGRVYNVFLKTDDPEKNVISVGGFLSGTAYFQNEGTQFLNREILRSSLIHGAVEQ